MNKYNFDDLLQVGGIIKPHGVKGEVKVFPTTDDLNRFDDLVGKQVIVKKNRELMELKIESVKYFKNQAIVKFEGYDKIEDVETLRQCPILVTRDNAVKLKPGEYFIADLIGLKALYEDGSDMGELVDVIQTGANDVYVINMDGKEVMVPNIPPCIKKIDLETKTITIHLLDGLLDL